MPACGRSDVPTRPADIGRYCSDLGPETCGGDSDERCNRDGGRRPDPTGCAFEGYPTLSFRLWTAAVPSTPDWRTGRLS